MDKKRSLSFQSLHNCIHIFETLKYKAKKKKEKKRVLPFWGTTFLFCAFAHKKDTVESALLRIVRV